MDAKRIRALSNGVIFGLMFYLVCIFIGMILYPGGARSDPIGGPYSEGYSFFGNYLSDIGRVIAINGETNTPAMILFYIGTASYGLTLFLFALIIPSLIDKGEEGAITSTMAKWAGILACFGTFVYTFAPTDTMQAVHLIGVYIAYACTLISAILLSLSVRKNPKFSKKMEIVLITFSVLYGLDLIFYMQVLPIPVLMFLQKGGRLITIITYIYVCQSVKSLQTVT